MTKIIHALSLTFLAFAPTAEAGYTVRESAFGGYNIEHDGGGSTRCRPSAFGGYNCN